MTYPIKRNRNQDLYIRYIAVNCGDPTSNITNLFQEYVSGTKPNPTTYMAYTNIKCKIGYHWLDGSSQRTLTCQSMNIWEGNVPCVGKSKRFQSNFHNNFHSY